MNTRDFCFWLQGYFEILDPQGHHNVGLNSNQVETIKNHLNMVFVHDIDPSMGDKKHQDKLNDIHHGKNNIPGMYGLTQEQWDKLPIGERPRC